MNYYSELDKVRTFPLLQTQAPNTDKRKDLINTKKRGGFYEDQFPGLLRTTSRSPTVKSHTQSLDYRESATQQVSYSFANLKLDGSSQSSFANFLDTSRHHKPIQTPSELSLINIGHDFTSKDEYSPLKCGIMNHSEVSVVPKEVRCQNQFIIYRGVTLSSTPAFQFYHHTYSHNWIAITRVIKVLEEYIRSKRIQLAIIDGIQLRRVALIHSTLNIADEDNLVSCIVNVDDINNSPSYSTNKTTQCQSIIVIQGIIRKFLHRKRCKTRIVQNLHAVSIQKYARRILAVRIMKIKLAHATADLDSRWSANVQKIRSYWDNELHCEEHSSNSFSSLEFRRDGNRNRNSTPYTVASQSTLAAVKFSLPAIKGNPSRLLIFLPSITSAEYTRLFTNRFQVIQNMHIACLYQLIDPLVHVAYISPFHFSKEEMLHTENLLSTLGISTSVAGVKRLHYIVPEMIEKLPRHLSLSHVLWCSTSALKKIKSFIRQIPNAMIIPTSVSWAEKRISSYIDAPMMSPDPTVASTITSRSFSIGIFKEASVNVPLGIRDIFTTIDFYVALSSLIASNKEVKRWKFRLNADISNEGYAYLDVSKLSIVASLRSDIAGTVVATGTAAISSKNIQLELRKKIMCCLRTELPMKATICRPDIQGNTWELFEKHYRMCGLVINAEQNHVMGCVLGLCFIDPCGAIHVTQGVDQLLDLNYQIQGYLGPQTCVSHTALVGATAAVARVLYEKWAVIGYVAVEFQAYQDSEEGASKLEALGFNLGLGPAFSGMGAAALAGHRKGDANLEERRGFLPSLESTEGKHFIYLPYAHYAPLSLCREEQFPRVCKMQGISFDLEKRIGTLFFPIDKIIGGCISTLCVSETRLKCLLTATRSLNIFVHYFGKDGENDPKKFTWDSLLSVLYSLRNLLRKNNQRKKLKEIFN